jgi:putative hydrolase of the HAD superfamily
MTRRYRGVLFDLFGTLIAFDVDRLPELDLGTERVRTTVGGLGDVLGEWLPGIPAPVFLRELLAVSDEIARARAVDHVELPSRERFRRTLVRLGCDGGRLSEAAVHLARAHMALIAAATTLPPAHGALLRRLHGRYRLGVVSNFDDTGTAHDILRRHGIAPYLDTVVISEGLGLRKPHPALVRAGLRGLGLEACEVLFVGDTYGEDVAAARAAGVDAAWLDVHAAGVPAGELPPHYVVRTLSEVAAFLGPE